MREDTAMDSTPAMRADDILRLTATLLRNIADRVEAGLVDLGYILMPMCPLRFTLGLVEPGPDEGKGRANGPGKGDKGGMARRTPDGRMICFKYKDRNSRCDGRCNKPCDTVFPDAHDPARRNT